jgi:hypothetical protein
MSESPARTCIGKAALALLEAKGLTSAERVLIYASLAQAEAILEVADLLRSGIRLGYAEELANAMNHLASKLPDR